MKKINITMIIIIFIFSLFIISCAKTQETQTTDEEFTDTGILVIESTPSAADVYVNEKLEGQTPLTLYNMPVGSYNVKIRKGGYNDFEKNAVVKVGASEEIDATLANVQKEQQIQESVQQEQTKEKEQQESSQSDVINLASFAMYHDFEGKSSASAKSGNSDVFSRKYNDYVDFAALAPAKIGVIEKPFMEISKADCINTNKGVAQLKIGQSLCAVTTEGNYFALNLKTINDLEYKKLS